MYSAKIYKSITGSKITIYDLGEFTSIDNAKEKIINYFINDLFAKTFYDSIELTKFSNNIKNDIIKNYYPININKIDYWYIIEKIN